jgi:hypothetical protein
MLTKWCKLSFSKKYAKKGQVCYWLFNKPVKPDFFK